MTAPAATTRTGGEADDRAVTAVQVLARTCAAEWTRLVTVRTTWWSLAAAAVAVLGIAAAAGNDASSDPGAVGDAAWAAAGFTMLPGQFAFLALALLAVTSDYATGGILPTLQWTTRRTVVFAARAAVTVAFATGAAVLLASAAAVTAYVTGQPALTLPAGDAADVLGDVALVVGAGAALSVGLGFLLRSTAGVLTSVFLLVLVLPVMLPNLPYEWAPDVAQRLPGAGAAYLLVGQVDGMTETSSRVVLLAWAAGALVLGWLRLVRTDADR